MARRVAEYEHFAWKSLWAAETLVFVVLLIGGFLLGLWWVDQRSRKRHGGIRIY